ncbi:MAG: hypothetical protein O7H41_03455 [Planctomycetota bacterium]|nr:hypothetical protein [Planctomycetota bacterium]
MPRPLYILCCESYAVDSQTGKLSIFNLLEQIIRTKESSPKSGRDVPRPALSFVGMAAWGREENDDPNNEYEFDLRIHRPGEGEVIVARAGKFMFAPLPKLAYRFIVHMLNTDFWQESGEFRFESRIREIGSTEWLSQHYPVSVTVQTIARKAPQAPAGG